MVALRAHMPMHARALLLAARMDVHSVRGAPCRSWSLVVGRPAAGLMSHVEAQDVPATHFTLYLRTHHVHWRGLTVTT